MFIACLLLVALVAIATPANAVNMLSCKECNQVCFGIWGCEYFCTYGEDEGFERCYDSPTYCQQFDTCRAIFV